MRQWTMESSRGVYSYHFIYRWYYPAVDKKTAEELCVEQNREFFSDIRGRGGASNEQKLAQIDLRHIGG